MLVLSIETSCDETSLAFLTDNFSSGKNILEDSLENNFVDYLNSFEILGHIIASQIDIHKVFGGVIPEIGAREHANQIHFLFQEVLENSARKYLELKENMKNYTKKSQGEILEIPETKPSQIKNPVNSKSLEGENTMSINSTKINTTENLIESLAEEKIKEIKQKILGELDYIFVTATPGLASALRVGVEFAKTLEFFIDKNYQNKVTIKNINHLQGHLASCFWAK